MKKEKNPAKELEDKIKFQNGFRKLIRWLIALGILASVFLVFKTDLLNDNKDTFTFTNYGFAIMLGYASICFSWAKNQHEDITELVDNINFNARQSFYFGIVFLMGSIFKYIISMSNGTVSLGSINITLIPYILSKICLLIALFAFLVISIQILKLIDRENSLKDLKRLKKTLESKKIIDEIDRQLIEVLASRIKTV